MKTCKYIVHHYRSDLTVIRHNRIAIRPDAYKEKVLADKIIGSITDKRAHEHPYSHGLIYFIPFIVRNKRLCCRWFKKNCP